MDITVEARINGAADLDPVDYYLYEDGEHTIEIRRVFFYVGAAGRGADTIIFSGGTGYRVLTDGSLGTKRRQVHSGRGVPEGVKQAVLVQVRDFIAKFGTRRVSL